MASKEKQKDGKKVFVPKTAYEIQRTKLDKLMKKPNKEVVIPGKREEKLPRVFNPPEFIRNIWGSSAGAGSGDFHVYRGVRRREYARQKYINEKAAKDALDDGYHEKVVQNQKETAERTAKKRAKRQKKKKKQKNKKPKLGKEGPKEEEDEEDEDEDEEEEEEEKGGDDKTGNTDTVKDLKTSKGLDSADNPEAS